MVAPEVKSVAASVAVDGEREGRNFLDAEPISLVAVLSTDMDSYVLPGGTVTVKLVTLAAVTVARVSPKYTMLFAAVALKLRPVIVTLVPGAENSGAKELMIGCVWAWAFSSADMHR
jgi:hypothetical protein